MILFSLISFMNIDINIDKNIAISAQISQYMTLAQSDSKLKPKHLLLTIQMCKSSW